MEFSTVPPAELTEGQIEIIEFGSKAIPLEDPLRYAGATMRELTGVIFAFKKMYRHLLGRKFVVFTDHSALVHLFTKEPRSPLILRWLDIIMSLTFEVIHWPGSKNAIADALSRRSCIPKGYAHEKREVYTVEMIEELVTGKNSPKEVEERVNLIKEEHRKGHFGVEQLFKQLWTREIHWQGIREDIRRVVGECEPCLRFVVTQEGFHPYTPITECWPMKRTTIDLIVKVPKSKAGYQHILMYMCLATRFIWIKPLKTKTMEEVMGELLRIHRYFGKPLTINSDNGKEFVNKLQERLVEQDEIEWRTISSYNSRGQGSMERQNRDAEVILKKSVDGNYENWEDKCDDVAYFMNTRINSRTNSMAFVLMFGRVPLGLQKFRLEKKIAGYMEEMPEEVQDMSEWKGRLQLMNDIIYPTVAKEVERKQGLVAAKLNEERKLVSFDVDELVMAKDVTRESKWEAKYVGPFRVIRCNQGGAYLLEDRAKRRLPFRFPPSHLKKAPFATEPTESSYVVKKILNHKGVGDLREYLVEWEDRTIMNSWIPKENFDGTGMIFNYEKKKEEHHPRLANKAGYDFADWSLNRVVVATIKEKFGIPKVDLFATALNSKAECYLKRDKTGEEIEHNCLGTDAYKYDWNQFKEVLCWINPPFDEIMKVVDKAIEDDLGKFILITPYTNRRIEYLAGGEKAHLITHTRDVFIPVSRQGSKSDKGVGLPHWKGDYSYAYLCDTEGKKDAMKFNGAIPKVWQTQKEIIKGKERLREEKVERLRVMVPVQKKRLIQTIDGSAFTKSRRLQGIPTIESIGGKGVGEVESGSVFTKRRRLQGIPITRILPLTEEEELEAGCTMTVSDIPLHIEGMNVESGADTSEPIGMITRSRSEPSVELGGEKCGSTDVSEN